MAKKINVEKILKEISKGNVNQQVEALSQVKLLLTENLQKQQQELQALNNMVNGAPVPVSSNGFVGGVGVPN